ncbi:MFS general substrate transporter [Ganoderma leucocontextum]|nr:MFS general substrate transporter [Ganoderma leucocontextum]
MAHTGTAVSTPRSATPDLHDDATTIADPRSETVSLTDQTNLLPRKKVMAVFFGLALCILVSCLDSTIPLYGRFSDIFGRKVALCLAMGIFMVGSLAAGFSRTIIQLIVLRGVAGVGGGGIVSMAQIVISDVVSLRDRGKYQGIIGVVVAFGFAVGPLLGGVLAEKAGWRWCFWVTLPVSLCAAVFVLLVLPLKPVEGNFGKKLAVVDYLGTVLTLGGCTLVVLPLIWGGVTFPWTSPVVLAPLCSGVLVVALFCLWEWKGARLPIIPMYIFKQVTITGVYITMFINGVVFYSSLFYLPQYFQVALSYTAVRSGVFLLPVLVSQTLASFITASGQMISRTGRYRTNIYCGFAIWTVGCGCLSTVTPSTPKGLLVFYMLIAGTGAGGTLQTTTVAAQASVSRRDMSVVTAVRNFIRLLGGTFSLAIGATIINNTLRHTMSALHLAPTTISKIVDDPTVLGARTSASASSLADLGVSAAVAERILGAYIRGFRTLFILNTALNAVATVAAVVLIRHIDLTRGDEEVLKQKAIEEALAAEKASVVEAPGIVVPAASQEKEKPFGEENV